MGNQNSSKDRRPSNLSTSRRPSDLSATRRTSELQKRPSETGATLTRKPSQAEELSVFAKKSDLKRKTSSSSDISKASTNAPQNIPVPEIIPEDSSQQRGTLFDHLVAFYFRNDNERLMRGDVDIDGICDWALSGGHDGITALNARLKEKYGEDLDSFLINAALDSDSELEGDGSQSDIDTVNSVTKDDLSERRELSNEAALERPAIKTQRRRPTNNANRRFTLNSEGELDVPLENQLDHSPPPDLKSQLHNFILEMNPSRVSETDRFVKFAEDHGLVALNSELLVTFGKDLKGNTLDNTIDEHSIDPRKFGVGLDTEVLKEMQEHKLQHEEVGAVSVAPSGVCNRFRLDTESPIFGMCKCGHDRSAHLQRSSVVKSSTLERKLQQRRESINISESQIQKSTNSVIQDLLNSSSHSPNNNQNEKKNIFDPKVNNSSSIPKPTPTPPPHQSKLDSSSLGKSSVPLLQEPNTPSHSNFDSPSTSKLQPSPEPKTFATHSKTNSSLSYESKSPISHSTSDSSAIPKSPTIPKHIPQTSTKPDSSSLSKPKPPRPKSKKHTSIERLKPGEKKNEPCSISEFQLDMSANEFGICANCGWKRQDHKAKTDQEVTASRPVSVKLNGPLEPCNQYKLDMTADAFGVCICGFPKQAHKGQSSNQKAVSRTLEKRWSNMKEVV